MGAIIVVDALWGDSGKGKIASYIAEKTNASLCVRAGTGTNAGHSLYLDENTVIKTNQLPLSGILSGAQLRVGSGVAVDPNVFFRELDLFKPYGIEERVKLDGRSPVILPEYLEMEKKSNHLNETVGSTLSGTGIAQAQFCLRKAKQVKDIELLRPYTTDVAMEINERCRHNETIVVEGSQGTWLSVALTHDYPYCTSGNCTAAACVDDIGLNWQYIKEVILVVKAVPSRVGTGPLPCEIPVEEQDRRGIAEYGVRTGRRRRKSGVIPMELLKESVMLNGSTQIALTFCDHYDSEMKNAKVPTAKIEKLIDTIQTETNIPVTIIDSGKFLCSVEEYKGHTEN